VDQRRLRQQRSRWQQFEQYCVLKHKPHTYRETAITCVRLVSLTTKLQKMTQKAQMDSDTEDPPKIFPAVQPQPDKVSPRILSAATSRSHQDQLKRQVRALRSRIPGECQDVELSDTEATDVTHTSSACTEENDRHRKVTVIDNLRRNQAKQYM
jgi:hypothetical protein